jgi:hypothetical protein
MTIQNSDGPGFGCLLYNKLTLSHINVNLFIRCYNNKSANLGSFISNDNDNADNDSQGH